MAIPDNIRSNPPASAAIALFAGPNPKILK
jgi:hypothetical protein